MVVSRNGYANQISLLCKYFAMAPVPFGENIKRLRKVLIRNILRKKLRKTSTQNTEDNVVR